MALAGSQRQPFAVIVMAHLKALATRRQPKTRLEWKLRLAKALYDRDYSEEQVQQLVDFIDWLMVLDERWETRFDEALRRYEEERTMPTLSPYQRRFIAKGELEGLREALLVTLEVRFNGVPQDIIDAVNQIEDRNVLMKLQHAAVQIATVEEFRSLQASVHTTS